MSLGTWIQSNTRFFSAVIHDITTRKKADDALKEAIAFRNSIFTTLPDLIWLKDPDGVYLSCNPAFERFFGAKENKIIGKTDYDFVDKELANFFRLNDKVAMEAGHPSKNEEWVRFAYDGSRVLLETTKTPITLLDGTVLGVLGVGHDITKRKQSEDKLKLAASVFTYAREGIVITDANAAIIEVNDAFTYITGYDREEVLGKNPRILKSGRHGSEFYTSMWDALTIKGHWYGEIWNRHKNGELYAELLTISCIRDDKGNIEHYVALFSDITAQKEQQQQLEHIAHYDALTGLPNRVLLADRLYQAMSQVQRRKQHLAVIFLDLDGFKAVNDTHGHEVGDQLLTTIANRMKLTLRDGDTIARIGGDEFVAVLIDLPNSESSLPMLTRLLDAAAQPEHISEQILQVSASLGVTFYPQSDTIEADQLLRQADQAMYQAKLAGKNQYYVFDAEHDRHIRGNFENQERIRDALNNDELELFYQPKVNMHTGEVVGAEALIRWHHPDRGLLPPALFLPATEDSPLAIEIGEWVIDTALSQLECWKKGGLNIIISVNVCAYQIQQTDFSERLQQLLTKHPGINPGNFELEILETSALEDMTHISQVMNKCLDFGVNFALDDFGTGYSSLTYLKRLPATELKIDRSFVRNMLDDPGDLAILEGVMGLATAFQRRVIAEGVETESHGEML